MRVRIVNNYNSGERVLDGTPDQVRAGLLQALPWLVPHEDAPLDELLELADAGTMYDVVVEEQAPDEGRFEPPRVVEPDALGKNETLLAQAGLDQNLALLWAAAAFLAGPRRLGQARPEARSRAGLWDHGGDVEAAVLAAHDLPVDDRHRRTLRATARLLVGRGRPSLGKAEVSVEPFEARGQNRADLVRAGLRAGQGQPVTFLGRHSAGMQVVEPPEGQALLLKPGSGKQSPALGVRQEGANQSRREAVFYRVAEAWGLASTVPRCDLLLIDGKEIACLTLLPPQYKNLDRLEEKHPGRDQEVLRPYLNSGVLFQWAVLDYVLGQPDRHGMNMMAGPRGDVWLIDHGSALAGRDFDPAKDKNSFIPYYLRAWVPRGLNFNTLSAEDRLRYMPRLGPDGRQTVAVWLHGLHAEDLEAVLTRYGIDPGPCLERLARLKSRPGPVDDVLVRTWLDLT